jgi:hypothetical protein
MCLECISLIWLYLMHMYLFRCSWSDMRPSKPDSHSFRHRTLPSVAEEAKAREEEVKAVGLHFP